MAYQVSTSLGGGGLSVCVCAAAEGENIRVVSSNIQT